MFVMFEPFVYFHIKNIVNLQTCLIFNAFLKLAVHNRS